MPSAAEIQPGGVYLLDAPSEHVLWVGAHASPSFVEALFGTARPTDASRLLPPAANAHSKRLEALLEATGPEGGARRTPLRVLVQGSHAQMSRFFKRLFADGYEQATPLSLSFF